MTMVVVYNMGVLTHFGPKESDKKNWQNLQRFWTISNDHVQFSVPNWSKQTIFATSFSCGCFLGICQICDLQVLKDIWSYVTNDVSYFKPYPETKNKGGGWKVCIKQFSLGLGSEHVLLKSQVALCRSFLAVLVFLLMFQLMWCECFVVILW